jgi:hypothetical protein
MRALLAKNDPVPAHLPDAMRRAAHVTYCFSQMIRFNHLAASGVEPFRAAQFGLSLGRVQELLGCIGSKAAWWGAFEPLLIEQRHKEMISLTQSYMALLGLTPPDDAFINKR